MNVSDYLFRRIRDAGVTHSFGIPGDFALPLYAAQEKAGLKTIVMTHEPSVGYAADVYARIHGLGVAIVTYGVGTLNMVNAVAMAYAEESPVLVLAGAPEVGWQVGDTLFHHRVKSPATQLRVMREVTVAQASILDPTHAVEAIDEVFDAIRRHSRPGFIEIARDLVFAPVTVTPAPVARPAPPNREALDEAVAEIVARLNAAERPVICAGVEIERFDQMPAFRRLVEKLNVPVATSLMGKAVLPENHPNSIGTYFGRIGPDDVRKYVEAADCVLALGMHLSDVDVGFDSALLARRRMIQATADGVNISHHRYPGIALADVLAALLKADGLTRHGFAGFARSAPQSAAAKPWGTGAIIDELNRFLTPAHVVIADTGDCLFASVVLRAEQFIGPGYYASMGLAIPGAIAAQIARPNWRPVVLIGDGSFKMNGVELGTARDYGLNPIVIVLNNRSFGTLRAADRDREYYRVRPWDLVGLAASIGGHGIRVTNIEEFRAALREAQASTGFVLIDAQLPEGDASPTLLRLGTEYGGKIRVE
ncbi:MAG: hypothetical protein K1X57_16810 [Gemmataceae bacterium]|nr:hypothetical protein [Gemmataceae bacterium]